MKLNQGYKVMLMVLIALPLFMLATKKTPFVAKKMEQVAGKAQQQKVPSQNAQTLSTDKVSENLSVTSPDRQQIERPQIVATAGPAVFKPDAAYVNRVVNEITADCKSKSCKICVSRTQLAVIQFGQAAYDLAGIACQYCNECRNPQDLSKVLPVSN